MVTSDLLAQMRPVFWNPIRSAETCEVCTRPVDQGDLVCSTCRGHAAHGVPLADSVVPLTYAPRQSQAMTDTYKYKDEMVPEIVSRGARRRLFGLFAETMERHAACIAGLSAQPRITTIVPSSSGRTPHPLDITVSRYRTYRPLLRYVGPAGDQYSRRVFAPERWEVTSEVDGHHVLLVDDTWVSGAHVQSCASALKQAGAAYVTALVLARHLDEKGAAPDFLARHRTRVYDPAICPVTGALHPDSASAS